MAKQLAVPAAIFEFHHSRRRKNRHAPPVLTPVMIIEHVAFQHPDSVKAAEWYAANFGMKVVRASENASKARFLADSAGKTVLEIYTQSVAPMPDYPAMNPLVLHVAFLCADIHADAKRLVAAGAVLVEAPATTPSGDTLGMLRDPWGVPIQLAQRAKPLVG